MTPAARVTRIPTRMRLSFDNAAQVLTAPGARAAATCAATAPASSPSSPAASRSNTAGSRRSSRRADANIHIDASGCALLPGLVDCHTHLPFAGWRAGEYEQKVTGVPVRGDRARRRRHQRPPPGHCARPLTKPCSRRRRSSPARCCARGRPRSSASPATGSRPPASSAPSSSRPSSTGSSRRSRPGPRCSRTPCPDGYTTTTWMDEVQEMLPEALEHASALDIFVESIAFGLDDLDRMGELASANGVRLRAHVEQFTTMRSVPVALKHNARSVDHLATIHPDDIGPLARVGVRGRAATRCRVHGRRGDCAGAGPDRRRRDHGARHRRQPGHLADLLAAADRRPRRPPLRPQHARGAARGHAQRRVGPRPVRASSGRSSSTSAPTSCCSTARPSTSPTDSAATPSRRRSSAASPRTSAPTRRGESPRGEPSGDRRRDAFPLGAAVTLEQLEQDPHPVLARLREHEPVSWLPALDGWLVTRHDLATAVMRDSAHVHRRRPALLHA